MTQADHIYRNKLRIRICGLCLRENAVLLVNHTSLNKENEFWMPPGGGLEFGETIEACLQREFMEETGHKVSVLQLLWVHEHIAPPLHAIEHFYEVVVTGGSLSTGIDPEVNDQIIKEVKWFELDKLTHLPDNLKHPVLNKLNRA